MSNTGDRTLWQHPRVRRAAIVAAALIAVAAASVAYAWHAHRHARELAEALAGRLQTQRGELQGLTAFGSFDAALGAYFALRERGFVGTLDPVALIDSVQAAAARLGLPAPEFELGPPKDAAQAAAGDGVRQLDLEVALAGVHEEEAMALLDALQQTRHGLLQPRACTFVRRTDGVGLTVKCLLRLSVLEMGRERGS